MEKSHAVFPFCQLPQSINEFTEGTQQGEQPLENQTQLETAPANEMTTP